MGMKSLRFRVYVACLVVTALAVMVLTWIREPPPLAVALAMLLAINLMAEALAVALPWGGSISLVYPLSIAAAALYGPAAGGLVAATCMVPSLFTRPRPPLVKFAFNVSQMALSSAVAGVLYQALGGRSLAGQALRSADFPGMLVPIVALSVAGFAMNFVLMSGLWVALGESKVTDLWRLSFSWMLPTQIVLGFLGVSVAQVVAIEGPVGLVLLVLPLFIARQTYQRYQALREAYADTVRSLVAAIEAKDPYTKGHSVRVAYFTVGLARAMSMDEEQVERLEVAALLHDLGKIGISRTILSKPSSLTADEYLLIKQHPDIAARILESVPFLGDVLPVVQGHHERVDGGGYGQALNGQHIPIGARILAIADSYDAMTAARPYRPALTGDEARAELVRGKDSQFDADIVDVFLAALETFEDPESNPAAPTGVEVSSRA